MSALTISNYQLGDLLGRGASGSVYRALNFLTGETVAIKSISLLSLPASSLPDIMSEIDLLKNLNHPNIVKYKGFARDKENLFIVLEYCENGSLQSILKRFGKFPESLVAVYVSQVLEGLIYLHEQGVIHRDIKGANILTNKDGSVKLADFGVSSRAPGAGTTTGGGGGGEKEMDDNEVVGSPYWMAPEVIEQSGASTASDIWSVGCVVVELLEGRPPYGDLAPMQALWRIVQDESMRIPEGSSPIVKDFLYHCFQKDPHLRITAKKLLRHPWMLSARRHLEPAPTSALQPRETGTNGSLRSTSIASVTLDKVPQAAIENPVGSMRLKKPMTVYDEAVQRVQEWNEALNASPKALGTIRRAAPPHTTRPRKSSIPIPHPQPRPRTEHSNPQNLPTFNLPLPTRSSADSLHTQTGTTPNPPQTFGAGFGGKLYNDVLTRARESEGGKGGESWDDDFAADITLSNLGHRKEESHNVEEQDQKTLKPSKTPSPAASRSTSNTIPKLQVPKEQSDEDDYSDLAFGETDLGLKGKLAYLKPKKGGRRLIHPDDIKKLGTLAPSPLPIRATSLTTKPRSDLPPLLTPLSAAPPKAPPAPQRSLSTPNRPTASTEMRQPPTSATFGKRPLSPLPPKQSSSPNSRSNSLRRKGNPADGLDLEKYTENDEDNYEDIFHQPHSLTSLNEFGETGGKFALAGPSSHSLKLTKRSNSSLLDDEDGEENDPFAEIDDGFDGEDLEANLLRDKRATLLGSVSRLVDGLEPGSQGLKGVCDELLGLLEGTPDMGLENHFVASHGMLAILEVLESRLSRDVAVRLLKIVNTIVASDVEMLESFCLIGGIPVIIPFTSKKYSLDTRLEASTFVQHLTRSPLTLQMFISCRGLRILVELLDEDYTVNKTLILSSLEGIGSVFDLQSPTPRNDFCRMFVREGILDPLSTAIIAILKDPSLEDDDVSARSINVLLLFCQVAQADARVREAFAVRTIIIRILKACEVLPRKLLVVAIKAIKHLSTSPQLIEVLQNSNAMEVLVSLLGKSIKGSHSNEICSHIFQTIFSMCRLNKARQEEAASSGIIPLLKKVIQTKSPLKQFALPILCDLANAGKVSRRLLWQNDGMKLYLDLLDDPYWRVSAVEAVLAWMQDETARVEDVLLEKSASESLIMCFVEASAVSFEGILDPYLKILRLSATLTSSISQPSFIRRLAESLEKQSKAVIKLNLLRITRVVCDNHPDRATLVSRFSLSEIVDKLAKQDEAILVRELAKEVYPCLLFGGETGESVLASRESGARIAERYGVAPGGEGVGGGGDGVRETVATLGTSRRVVSSMRRTTSESVVVETAAAKRGIAQSTYLPTSSSTAVLHPTSTITSSQVRSQRQEAATTTSAATATPSKSIHEKTKHKRKVSRIQLREVQWETDENGRVRPVVISRPT